MDRYKLNIQRDVDVDGYGEDASYTLCLPKGWRIETGGDVGLHTQGFDSMAELRAFVRSGAVVRCRDCKDCAKLG